MSAGSLVPRSSDKTYHSVEALLFLLLFTSPTQNQLSIWGDEVVAKYPNLTISKIKAWIAAKISSTFSNDDGVHQAVCNMDGLNDSLGGSSTVNCYCLTNDCCDTDDKRILGGEFFQVTRNVNVGFPAKNAPSNFVLAAENGMREIRK